MSRADGAGVAADRLAVSQLLQILQEQHLALQRQNAEVIERINGQLGRIGGSLVIQGLLDRVPEFTGKEKLEDWLQEINKSKLTHGLSDKEVCQLMWAKSRGTVSRVVGRKLTEKPTTTHEELVTLLENEYGQLVDGQHAFSKLTKLKQGKDEELSSYIERLFPLVERAYGEKWKTAHAGVVQPQLVGIFMEGLKDREVKLRIYRKGVTTIDEAIEIAKAEELSKRRFPLPGPSRGPEQRTFSQPRREEPMELGHHGRRVACFGCGGPHKQTDCPREGRRRGVNTVGGQEPVRRTPLPRSDPRVNKPPINRTQGSGRDYRTGWGANQGNQGTTGYPGRSPRVSNKVKEEDWRLRRCYRCHKEGHFAAQCQAQPLN